VTASAIVKAFIERHGQPIATTEPFAFSVPGQWQVTYSSLTADVFRHHGIAPRRSAIADAYETLCALARTPARPVEAKGKTKGKKKGTLRVARRVEA